MWEASSTWQRLPPRQPVRRKSLAGHHDTHRSGIDAGQVDHRRHRTGHRYEENAADQRAEAGTEAVCADHAAGRSTQSPLRPTGQGEGRPTDDPGDDDQRRNSDLNRDFLWVPIHAQTYRLVAFGRKWRPL